MNNLCLERVSLVLKVLILLDHVEEFQEQGAFAFGLPQGGDFPLRELAVQGAEGDAGTMICGAGGRDQSGAESGGDKGHSGLFGVHFLDDVGHEACLVKGAHEGTVEGRLGNALIEDEWFAFKVFDVEAVSVFEGVPVRYGEDIRLTQEGHCFEARGVVTKESDKCDVESITAEQGQLFGGGLGREVEPDVGILFAESADGLGQLGQRGRADESHMEMSCQSLRHVLNADDSFVKAISNVLAAAQKFAPLRRERDLAAGAFQQFDTQLFFQSFDLL